MFARTSVALILVGVLLLSASPLGPPAAASAPAVRAAQAATLAGPAGLVQPPSSGYALEPSAVGVGFREVNRQELPDRRAFFSRIVAPDAQPSGQVWVSSTAISFVDTRLVVFASTDRATAEFGPLLEELRGAGFNVEPAVGWGSDQVYSYAYQSGQVMYRGIALRYHNAVMALSVAGLEQFATWDNAARLARIVEEKFMVAASTEARASAGPPADGSDEVGHVVPDEGRQHAPQGTPIHYQNSPPSSGTHYPTWTRPGVYAEAQAPGNWVHSLEHGYIVILYNCAEPCPELIAQLTAFYESAPPSARYHYQKLVITPYADMSSPITAVAWNRRLELDQFDADQLMAFFRAYQDKGPEDVG